MALGVPISMCKFGLPDSRQTPIRMAEFKSAYGPKYAFLFHPIYDASIVERLRHDPTAENTNANPSLLPSVPPKPWISSRDRDNQCWASMIERGFGRWGERSCSRAGLRLEKMLTDCHSGTRLAFYGAPAVVGVLLFANGIPRVQRDILQKVPFLGDFFRKEIHPADNVSRTSSDGALSPANSARSPSKSNGGMRTIDIIQWPVSVAWAALVVQDIPIDVF
ncbi:hypothetical protein MRS44_006670 [Fusarium solani]|uniref:uncharacterized protein n=1 Tax=Fusarium solani TaxID=169388 RepID=UPI0032C46B5D|nr:hypothetical protein MRS44_006670 [Fusarium solani]